MELARRAISLPQIPIAIIGQMVLLKLPSHLITLLPFITLLGCLACFWSMNQRRELIAFKVSGISSSYMIIGLSILITLIGLFQLTILNPISSAFLMRHQNLARTYFQKKTNFSITEKGIWIREIDVDYQRIIHGEHFIESAQELKNVMIFEFDKVGNYIRRIDAKSVILAKNMWQIRELQIRLMNEKTDNLEQLSLSTNLTLDKIRESHSPPETIPFWQLSYYIGLMDKAGLSSLMYRLHWHRQLSKIGLMVVMGILAYAFSQRQLRSVKTGRMIFFGAIIGISVHFLNDMTYAMGQGKKLPVVLAAWAPSMFLLMLSILFTIHFEEQS